MCGFTYGVCYYHSCNPNDVCFVGCSIYHLLIASM